MHNCKVTRERFTEALLDGVETPTFDVLTCKECSEEFEQLKESLLLSTRAIEAVVPAEDFWLGYQNKLRRKLELSALPATGPKVSKRKSLQSSLSGLLFGSIRVPVPAALVVLLFFGFSLLFAVTRTRPIQQGQSVSIVPVPLQVEVPVIQEKIVTQIVYRPIKPRRSARTNNSDPSILARSQKPSTLTGFKPLDEIKLTVIKGGSPDEK